MVACLVLRRLQAAVGQWPRWLSFGPVCADDMGEPLFELAVCVGDAAPIGVGVGVGLGLGLGLGLVINVRLLGIKPGAARGTG